MAHTSSQRSNHIPTVTEVDLSNFHNEHFHPMFGPAKFFHINHLVAVDEHDDGLGYYADGVKRTLTDEQIAMFRHSEIQALLREKRRLQSDTSDRDGGDERPTAPTDLPVSPPQSMADSKTPAKAPPKSSNARKRKATANADHEQGNPTSGYTHRRIAREQDQVVDAHVELDY